MAPLQRLNTNRLSPAIFSAHGFRHSGMGIFRYMCGVSLIAGFFNLLFSSSHASTCQLAFLSLAVALAACPQPNKSLKSTDGDIPIRIDFVSKLENDKMKIYWVNATGFDSHLFDVAPLGKRDFISHTGHVFRASGIHLIKFFHFLLSTRFCFCTDENGVLLKEVTVKRETKIVEVGDCRVSKHSEL